MTSAHYSGAMNAPCSRCGQAKPGAVVAVTGIEMQGGAVGGQIVRAGDPPGPPFVCFDCEPWRIAGEPVEEPRTADRERWRYNVSRGDQVRDVIVELSGTVAASDPNTLPSPLDEAAATHGRSALAERLNRVEPPQSIYISSQGVRTTPRQDYYEPDDAIVFNDAGVWFDGTFDAPGDPDDAITDETGTKRDVAWVRPAGGGEFRKCLYKDIRAVRPES